MVDMQKLLERVGIPVAVLRFRAKTSLPNIVWYEKKTPHGADNKKLLVTRRVTIEFYSEVIDFRYERKIEALLDELDCDYDSERFWLTSENLYETTYTFEMEDKL